MYSLNHPTGNMEFKFPVRRITLNCPFHAPAIVENTIGEIPGFTRSPYWILCPRLNASIQDLESRGWIHILEDWIQGPAKHLWTASVEEIRSVLRRELEPAYAQALEQENRLFIGGIQNPDGLKCLHAHYAFYLMFQTGLIGHMVHGLLVFRKSRNHRYGGIWCEPQQLQCDRGSQP